VDAVVTYHDSCHLKKTMKVAAEPREVIKSIPGVTLKEMSAPDTCCGSGGSYVVSHYDTSASLGRNKAQDINQTGADTVSTGCPACMMQLLDNVSRYGQQQKVTHYISLLADSYRKEKAQAH
jgi:glycolate oxidase iron-sulfur subunit